jgi:hypothetical protein
MMPFFRRVLQSLLLSLQSCSMPTTSSDSEDIQVEESFASLLVAELYTNTDASAKEIILIL